MLTIYRDLYSKDSPNYISLEQCLDRVKSGKQKNVIEKIRGGDKSLKSKLPVVLFSGKFNERKDSSLIKHSGYIVLDFDHIDVGNSKAVLALDPFVKACWVSPSGDGLKAVVKVTNSENHRDHFRALVQYFDNKYNLEVDSTGINESRACFESYDPDAVIKIESEPFGKMLFDDIPKTQVAEVKEISTDYTKLHLAARMIRNAPDGEKHNVLLKAAILMGGYISVGRVDELEAYRVLEREIELRDVDDMYVARNTIRDGIERGKMAPIHETIEAEEEAQRELLLSDGDMSFMSSDVEDLDWIIRYKNGEIEKGCGTGNVLFDKNFIYKKEFVMISGHSSVGKTTFMLYMMVTISINNDWVWVIYSSENKTANVKIKLMQFACGKSLDEMTEGEVRYMMKWVSKHFILIDNTKMLSYADLLVYTEKITRHRKIDGLLIDPYNSLKVALTSNKSGSAFEYHYEAAGSFLTFCNRLDIAVWVNAHSITSAQRQKGDDGQPIAPLAPDTEYGGMWVNRADCFITIHRKIHHPDVEKRNRTEFHVRKVREQETGGEPTAIDDPFCFDFHANHAGFSMTGPFPKLYQHINIEDVDKQLEFEQF